MIDLMKRIFFNKIMQMRRERKDELSVFLCF